MTRIDARGMRCPWPAIRLARALRDGAAVVEIAADDPRAAGELANAAAAVGARLAVVGEDVFRVAKLPTNDPPSTIVTKGSPDPPPK